MMLHSETNKDFQPYTTDLDGTYKLFQFPSPGHEQSWILDQVIAVATSKFPTALALSNEDACSSESFHTFSAKG